MIDPTRPHHKRAETFAVPSSANMTATAAGDPTGSSNLIDLTANAFAANGYQTARSTASGGQIYQLPQPLVQLNQSKQSNDYYMSSYVLPPPQEDYLYKGSPPLVWLVSVLHLGSPVYASL